MKCSLLIGVVILLGTAVCRSEMQEGLSSERCLGRFGWNQSGSQELRDGLLFNGVDENGLEACIGLGNNNFRMWRMDFQTPAAPAQDPAVKVKWLKWIAKEVEVRKTNQNYNLTYSLASPGMIVDTASKQLVFNLKSDVIKHLAYQGQGGMVVKNITDLKEGIRGNDLKANWLLCFSGQEAGQRDVPFLLVLTRVPAALNVESNKVVLAGDIGKVIVALPFGLKTFDGKETETWGKGLPEEIRRQCEFWSRTLLEYPIDCREFYEIDEDNQEVKIEDRYEYLTITDAWHTVAQKVASMPPIISFARTEEYFKDHIRVLDKVEGLNYPTWYGPLEGNIGKASVAYVLPSPYSQRMIPLRIPDKSPLAEFISQGALNNKWAADLSMFLWLSPETRQKLLDADRKQLDDVLLGLAGNTIFYKEPSTGKGFYMHKSTISPTKDNGSFRIDRMRAYDMSVWPTKYVAPFYDYAIWSGDRRLLKANWERLKKLCDAWWVVNDWAFMSAFSTDEAGCNANNAVDCIWDTLAGMESVQGMAELAGDKAYADGVQYLRARQLPVSMLKLGLEWNYLPKYLYTFADNQFFIGIGELDTRYSPRIPFLLSDCKWLAPPELQGLDGWVLPLFFNHASAIWPGGPFALLCETAPATTLKYLRKTDELHPRLYFDKAQKDGGMLDDWGTAYDMYYNHLFLTTLLENKNAFREKANSFYPEIFQRQYSISLDEGLFPKGFLLKTGVSQFLASMAHLRSPVSLGEWGNYKIRDGSFSSGKARISLASTDDTPLKLRLLCRQQPVSVSVNNVGIKQTGTMPEWHAAKQGWFYCPGTLWINTENKPEISLEIVFADWQDREEPFPAMAPCDGNLLYNPGFEFKGALSTDVLGGGREVVFNRWQACVSPAYYDGLVSTSGERCRSGKLAARLALDKEAGFYQDVKGTPGKNYQAEFYFHAPDLAADKESLRFSLWAMKGDKIRQIVGEAHVVITESADKSAWRKVCLSLTCPEGADIIRVQTQYQPVREEGKAKKAVYIDDVSLTTTDSASVVQKTLPPVRDQDSAEQGLIFYASFNQALDADFAKGDGRAGFNTGLESIIPGGRSGNCLSLAKGGVNYYTDGNFHAGEGSLSIWIKPGRELCEKMRALIWWAGAYFWTEFNFTDYHRFSFGMDLPKKTPDVFNAFLQTECGGVSGKGERLTFRHSVTECKEWGNWHHVAATWKKGVGKQGKDQTLFYFDGVLLRTMNDAALPPVVRGVMTLGDLDPHRQYHGLLDELRIYDRVLSAEETKKLYERN